MKSRFTAPPVEDWPEDQRGDAWEPPPPSANGKATHGKPPPPTGPRAIVTAASMLMESKVDWLWHGYVPRGAITIFDGDPGLGKSTLAFDLAARISTGRPMPPRPGGPICDPASVLILSAEDDPEKTIRPRLRVAGADLDRVHIMHGVAMVDSTERAVVLPVDLDMIEELVASLGVVLVVIDPVMAFFDQSVNSHRDSDVRRVLHRIKQLAERTGCAVVLVRHLNKLGSGSAIYRGGGSIGIIGAARSALLVGRHPQNPDHRVLAPIKCNLCRMPSALEFAHETVEVELHRLRWIGEAAFTADEILTNPAGPRSGALDECKAALLEALKGGPVESEELTEMLGAMGFPKRTVERARQAAGVKSRRVGFGAEGRWMVHPPAPVEAP